MLVNKRKKRKAEIPTASQADLAFLLLIFFLVTTNIDTDKGIQMVLPEKGQETKVHKQNIANILINANGQVMMDEQPIEVKLIAEKARQMIRDNENIIFSVKTVRDTRYDVYIDVLDQLKMANAKRISIAEPEQ
ncbi:MAG: biopolymer transporter ExbD [candidate division KSB1 bacterium]|nr:biopolymer transporter ExbD [candidate division KSB1 bacterium]MDZ7345843.1 biopolymer transporter ExbD [candidate division KSB1 bacterium]MDZ7369602.1 biopolymer transporter ExbD [candidate division KSB1 bacterium]